MTYYAEASVDALDTKSELVEGEIETGIKLKSNSTAVKKEESEEKDTEPTSKRSKDNICEYCGAAFATRGALYNHVYRHTGGTRHVCPHCGKQCRDTYTLRGHVASHDVIKPYKCSECDKAYTVKSSLNKHMLEHRGVRKYTCDHCPKTFNHKPHLTRHLRKHTGERPYPCPLCERRFSIKHHRDAHILLHTDPLPFVCDKCGKAFSQSGQLKLHHVAHAKADILKSKQKENKAKESYCKKCEKSFASRANLVQHETIVHKGEKKFKCNMCSKTFGRKHSLKNHLKLHGKQRHGRQSRFKTDFGDLGIYNVTYTQEHFDSAGNGVMSRDSALPTNVTVVTNEDGPNDGGHVQYGGGSDSGICVSRVSALTGMTENSEVDLVSSFTTPFHTQKYVENLPVESEVTIGTTETLWQDANSTSGILVMNESESYGKVKPDRTWVQAGIGYEGDSGATTSHIARSALDTTELSSMPMAAHPSIDLERFVVQEHVTSVGDSNGQNCYFLRSETLTPETDDTEETRLATLQVCLDTEKNSSNPNDQFLTNDSGGANVILEIGHSYSAITYNEHAYSSLANQNLVAGSQSPSYCKNLPAELPPVSDNKETEVINIVQPILAGDITQPEVEINTARLKVCENAKQLGVGDSSERMREENNKEHVNVNDNTGVSPVSYGAGSVSGDEGDSWDINCGSDVSSDHFSVDDVITKDQKMLTSETPDVVISECNDKLNTECDPKGCEALLYVCKVCDRGFSTNGDLKHHRKTHKNARAGRCRECGRKPRRKSHLKSHGYETVARGRVCNVCVFCDKNCVGKDELKMHITEHFVNRDHCVQGCVNKYQNIVLK